jgi:hypothetical protein
MADDQSPKPFDALSDRGRAVMKEIATALAAQPDGPDKHKMAKHFAAYHKAGQALAAEACALGFISYSGGEPTV